MSKESSGTWNIWTGLSGGESEGGNVWLRLAKENHKRQTQGRGDFIRETMKQQSSYDPYSDSGSHITGHASQQSDPFSANISAVSSAHGTPLETSDGISSVVAQHVRVDNETGVTTVSEDLYGKVDYGDDGRSFLQIGADLAGSVMDQFQTLGEANSYNPSGYAANGFGNTNGLFAGFNGGAGNERRDQFGNLILTEGVQDYVEEGGRRYNLDFAGNRTETDAFGNALTGNDVAGFYASTGWDANQGGWSNTGIGSFYGTTSEADAGNVWGTSSGGGSANIWGTPDPVQSFYGYSDPNTASATGMWGATDPNTTSASGFWGASDPNANAGGGFWGSGGSQSSGWNAVADDHQRNAVANNDAWGIYGTSGHHNSGSHRRDEDRSNWFFNGNTTV